MNPDRYMNDAGLFDPPPGALWGVLASAVLGVVVGLILRSYADRLDREESTEVPRQN